MSGLNRVINLCLCVHLKWDMDLEGLLRQTGVVVAVMVVVAAVAAVAVATIPFTVISLFLLISSGIFILFHFKRNLIALCVLRVESCDYSKIRFYYSIVHYPHPLSQKNNILAQLTAE